MSSVYVREKVREWAQLPSITVPYYDTINVEESPTEDIWFTAEFETEYSEKITFCGQDGRRGFN